MTASSATALFQGSRQPLWLLPGSMIGLTAIALILAEAFPSWSRLLYFVPYTFLGNSLAPLPYDGAVVYLGAHYPVWLIVLVGTAATLLIEAWNMDVLARLLSREGTRAFRGHRITQGSLRLYRKAPFWSLVATCVLPVIPHYPMRILAVLAAYPLWKYQLSVILGRGTRYAALASFGLVFRIPAPWIVGASVVAFVVAVRSARKMNRSQEDRSMADLSETAPEEA